MVSRRKGLGIKHDWKFVSALPNDIFIGLLLAVLCLAGSQAATFGAAALVGLGDTADASNTGILEDNRGSIWLVGVILLVVIGAPLAEELLFRGLILRVLQKTFGSVFAIIASSLLFALPHWQVDATWQETVVLLSALGAVGLVLATGAVVTNRLGPAVIAHFLFNAIGTIVTVRKIDITVIQNICDRSELPTFPDAGVAVSKHDWRSRIKAGVGERHRGTVGGNTRIDIVVFDVHEFFPYQSYLGRRPL